MAELNPKDSTEKQIEKITDKLKANGAIINEIAGGTAKVKSAKKGLRITPQTLN